MTGKRPAPVPERGAVTIIPRVEDTIPYKLGRHDGLKGKAAHPWIDTTDFYRDAYFAGYAFGVSRTERFAIIETRRDGGTWTMRYTTLARAQQDLATHRLVHVGRTYTPVGF